MKKLLCLLAALLLFCPAGLAEESKECEILLPDGYTGTLPVYRATLRNESNVPLFAELDVSLFNQDFEVNMEEVRIDTYRAGGAGGQHVNRTDSAVRMTHIPTGIVAQCQNERSQIQNREVCLRILKSRLLELKQREREEQMSDIKGEMKKIEWGSQIRSYVFQPYTMVKDHRTGYESGNVDDVMDGNLDGFITAYLKMQ